MRARLVPIAGIGAGAIGIALALAAPTAGASGHSVGAAHRTPTNQLVHAKPSAHPSSKACKYNQADNDNGVGIVSQNFEATFDQYDAQVVFNHQAPELWRRTTIAIRR